MPQYDGEQKANIKRWIRLTAVSEVESLRNLLREQGLGSALPAPGGKSHPPAPTGFAALDALLSGGIPRGQITELVGQASSGRTSVTFAMLAEATARGEVAAYIDASDSLDPRSAQRAGIALERLLWVRCGMASFASPSLRNDNAAGGSSKHEARLESAQYLVPRQLVPQHGRRVAAADRRERLSLRKKNDSAWQAVNLISSAGGFGVIVLDLGGVTKYKLREWQSRQWLRLRRAIENSPTALVILASEHLASSVSALVLEIAREQTRWQGTPGVSLWLSGISAKIRVAHQRKKTNGAAAPERSCSLGIGE
jgi:hypothetical protein